MSVSFGEVEVAETHKEPLENPKSRDSTAIKAFDETKYNWLDSVLDGDEAGQQDDAEVTESTLSKEESARMKTLESFYAREEEANQQDRSTMRAFTRKQTIIGRTHKMLLQMESGKQKEERSEEEITRRKQLQQMVNSATERLEAAREANSTSIPVWVLRSFLPNSGGFDVSGYDDFSFAKSALENMSPFLECVMSKDFTVAEAYIDVLMSTKKWKEIVPQIVDSFSFYKQFIRFLKLSISKEVAKTKQTSTLFRQNSLASKMLTYYSTTVANEYMHKVLLGTIEKICEPDMAIRLEVDPSKIGKDLDGNPVHDVADNLDTLKSLAQELVDTIVNNLDAVPLELRQISHYLKLDVAAKFPNATKVNVPVAGFFFLRFLCPALAAPEAFGLMEEEPHMGARLALITFTNVIQCVANGVVFNKKKEHLMPLNDWMNEVIAQVDAFMDELSTLPEEFEIQEQKLVDTRGEEEASGGKSLMEELEDADMDVEEVERDVFATRSEFLENSTAEDLERAVAAVSTIEESMRALLPDMNQRLSGVESADNQTFTTNDKVLSVLAQGNKKKEITVQVKVVEDEGAGSSSSSSGSGRSGFRARAASVAQSFKKLGRGSERGKGAEQRPKYVSQKQLVSTYTTNDFMFEFADMLKGCNMQLPLVIVDLAPNLASTTQADQLADALIKVFEYHNESRKLAKAIVRAEYRRAESAVMLHSAMNLQVSMAARVLSQYFKLLLGEDWLQAAVSSVVDQIYSLEDEDVLEVNPDKAESFYQSNNSTKLVISYTSSIIENVVTQHDFMHLDAKKMCQFFLEKADVISDRTEEPPEFVAAGMIKTFVFTRLIVPALQAPHKFGLRKDAPPPHVKTSLVMLARVVRATVTNTMFEGNWATKINMMMQEMQEPIDTYVTHLMQPPEGFCPPAGMAWANVMPGLKDVFQFLQENKIDVYERLLGHRSTETIIYQTFDRLAAIVAMNQVAKRRTAFVNEEEGASSSSS